MATRPLRLRSLRTSALLVVLAVVASPLVFVFGTNAIESLFVGRTLTHAMEGRDEVVALVRSAPPPAVLAERVDAIARANDQRIRVLAADGTVAVDRDHLVGDGWLFAVGDFVYGPERVPVLTAFDAGRGPLRDRDEVVAAGAGGHAERCVHSTPGNLEICDAAAGVALAGGGAGVVHVQGSSRRALEGLYASRRQLLKLTGFVLALAIVLWRWMGRQMVRPVESLRDEMLERARVAAPRADLVVARTDEIGDLAAAFNALMATLAERGRANEAFVADLAHELKNPVASVRACAERLGEEDPLDDARRRRLAEVLRTSAVRLDALVTQFLELARAEGGLPDEAREGVDLGALLRGLARTMGEGSAARIDVAVEGGEPLEVRGVASRIESVLRNLLDNALSFARERVHVEARRDGPVAQVVVADDGPGIAPDDLPRVFERFFTTRGDRRGTGLGLALARAVVEAHAGTIRAESPPEGGARFVVRLPFTPG
ncbi:MAG TPA: HAMP domain-containing sensor histidine kinase [Polyangiaceae bacterium]